MYKVVRYYNGLCDGVVRGKLSESVANSLRNQMQDTNQTKHVVEKES